LFLLMSYNSPAFEPLRPARCASGNPDPDS
jgi:hypothetical protein